MEKRTVYFIALIISIIILALLFLFPVIMDNSHKTGIVEEGYIAADTIQPKVRNERFGWSLDSFRLEEFKVKSGQVLSAMLSGYGLSPQKIISIASSIDSVYDVRKIKAGNAYYLVFKNDSLQQICGFVYEVNPYKYLKVTICDSIHAGVEAYPIDTVIRSMSGIIHTSLWVDMYKNGATPNLINKLSDIFAWEIDFFRIEKGDKFKVVYEEIVINHKNKDVGKILTAVFHHAGKDYYAIPFVQNGKEDFFDEEGHCLRKMLLKAPLKFSRISSRFTASRYHPILKKYRPHYGVDYAAPYGTPVHAVGDGTIIQAGYTRGGGNTVKIRHNGAYTTGYLHLSRFAKGIRKGVHVIQGQTIGYVGSTGLSTGPHLDYRIWKSGQPVDPLKLDLPPVESIHEENMEAFSLEAKKFMALLSAISYPVENPEDDK